MTPDPHPPSQRVLLVDDNPANLDLLYRILDGRGFKLHIAKSGEVALRIARKLPVNVVLLDVTMLGMDGYETCRRLKEDPDTSGAAVVFLSARSATEDKIRGLELGAVDFITKPFDAQEVIARVETQLQLQQTQGELQRRTEQLEHELQVALAFQQEAASRVEGPLLGSSPAVEKLRARIAEVAGVETPVLLVSPPGAGVERVARAIHDQSIRSGRAFIYVDCALQLGAASSSSAIQEALDEPERLLAKLELATGGTILLHGIDRLTFALQDTLRLVLGAEEAEREQGRPPRARVIASVDRRTLEVHPKDGLIPFLARREVVLPSLVERVEDIPRLIHYYLWRSGQRLGKRVVGASQEALRLLTARRWAGNITELRNVLEQAVLRARGATVEAGDLALEEGVHLGSYRLERQLDSGGMGEVWQARHRLLALPAAIKLIRRDRTLSHKGAQRFEQEARATARLESPHTVRLYDFGVSEAGEYYYVMELLKGINLRGLVRWFGPLPPERAVMLLRQACRSLAEAHDAGLIHRDIKPQNLMTCRLGAEYDFLKVLDFGLVKGLGATEAYALPSLPERPLSPNSPTPAREGNVVGTPAYVAPELTRPGGAACPRSDLYSLGCVAYWLLTGRRVFKGITSAELLRQHRDVEVLPPSELARGVPDLLDRLVLACLAKRPEDRPPSAHSLERSLGEVVFDRPWTRQRAAAWWKESEAQLERYQAQASEHKDETPTRLARTRLRVDVPDGTPTPERV